MTELGLEVGSGNRVVREYQLRPSTDDMLERLARALGSIVYKAVVVMVLVEGSVVDVELTTLLPFVQT